MKKHPTAYQLSNMLAVTELQALRTIVGTYPHDNCMHDKFYSAICDCRECEKEKEDGTD